MIHLQLQPETEAQLAAEAKARGMELNRYIETIVIARPVEREGVTSPIGQQEAQLDRDLRQGLFEIANGNTHPAHEVFAELREEYDIRG